MDDLWEKEGGREGGREEERKGGGGKEEMGRKWEMEAGKRKC